MRELKIEDIAADHRQAVSVQDYSAKPTIEGVEFVDLPHFTDDGGSFVEVARLTDGEHDWLHGVEVRQISFSAMEAGVIKGFHLHFKQDDVWFIPPTCRMLVVLHDARENSPSKGVTSRFVAGGGKAKIFRIPAGVAHGVRNLDNQTGYIFYLVSQQFSKDDPDERRLPWDQLGKEIWEIAKG